MIKPSVIVIRTLVIGALLVVAGFGLKQVSAHQEPPGCNSNNIDLNISRNKTLVRNGDVITYTIQVVNLDDGGSVACDITDATVEVTLPAADGTPTGASHTMVSDVDYPAGTTLTVLGTVDYTVDVNPGVVDAVAQAELTGVLHDAPEDHAAEILKTVGTQVTQPDLDLAKSVDSPGHVDMTVKYNYVLTNDSSTPVPIENAVITDDKCAPVTFTGGDSNNNDLLDVGEDWTFTCSTVYTSVGNYTNTAVGSGVSTVDDLPVTSESDSVTLVVTELPGLPNTGVVKASLFSWLPSLF